MGKLLPFVLKTFIYPLITSMLDIVLLKNDNISHFDLIISSSLFAPFLI